MTKVEAIAKIVAETPLSEGDANGLGDCSPEELSEIFAAVNDRHESLPVSTWVLVLAIFKACVEVANLVIPLASAIEGVYGVGQLL